MLDQRFLSVRQASHYTSLSMRLIYRLIQDRKIQFHRVGKRLLLEKSVLDSFIDSGRVDSVEDWVEKLNLRP